MSGSPESEAPMSGSPESESSVSGSPESEASVSGSPASKASVSVAHLSKPKKLTIAKANARFKHAAFVVCATIFMANASLRTKCFWENMSAAPTCASSIHGDSGIDLYRRVKKIQAYWNKRRAAGKRDDEEDDEE